MPPFFATALEAAIRGSLRILAHADADVALKCNVLDHLSDLAKAHRHRRCRPPLTTKRATQVAGGLSAASLFHMAGGLGVLIDLLRTSTDARLVSATLEAIGIMLLFDDETSTHKKSFQQEGGINVALLTMKRFHGDDKLQHGLLLRHSVVLLHLLVHAKRDIAILIEMDKNDAIGTVVATMEHLPADSKTQHAGCLFLMELVSWTPTTSIQDAIHKKHATRVVTQSLLRHRKDDRVRSAAISALRDLARLPRESQSIIDSGGLSAAVSLLKKFPTRFLHTNVCRIVELLAQSGHTHKVVHSGCIPLIVAGLKQRRTDEVTIGCACTALRLLAYCTDDAKEAIVESGGIHLLSSLQKDNKTKNIAVQALAHQVLHCIATSNNVSIQSLANTALQQHARPCPLGLLTPPDEDAPDLVPCPDY